MFTPIRKIRSHFYRHRFAYGIVTGMSIAGYLAVQRANEWNEFLDKHGLMDEFYEMEN